MADVSEVPPGTPEGSGEPEGAGAPTVLSPDEVAHLGRLARIAVTDEELSTLARDLEVILQAVARVGEVAAPDVPPMTHAVPLVNVTRPDVVTPCLDPADVLAGAPVAEQQRFRVPRILGEED